MRAHVFGLPNAVDVAVETLADLADLVQLEISTVADARVANVTICIGITWEELRSGANQINFADESGVLPPAFSALTVKSGGEIMKAAVFVARSGPEGETFAESAVEALIREQVVQAFDPRNDFLLSEFGDVSSAQTSLFANLPLYRDMNLLDRRMVSALYNAIPTGSTWEQALDHIEVVDFK